MRRRTLLRRLGGASGLAVGVGATSVASAATPDESVTIVWTFGDGRTERMTAPEFDRRSDTPSLAAVASSDCCDCPDPTICQCSDNDCLDDTA